MESAMLVKVLVVVVLVAFLALGQALAAGNPGKAEAPANKQEELLPGSAMKTEEAAKNADIIVVAMVVKAQKGQPKGPGGSRYKTDIEVLTLLKGETKEKELTIEYEVISIPYNEVAPKEKGRYIFFLKGKKAEDMEVLKVLADTEENRAEIAKALTAKPAKGK